ncbi:Capsule assembly protein Wzi [Treponema berlinense]|uniref:Capsule assembly protein Wzi n=1 Tax=Treponema berlinense TaxID=225004 RepID=A0A1T4KXF0_9SPIR|nr:capsule assembly Wzi family protein [Treponema berlinense]SJZ47071.1 Capsule assembly protein Wzi [Treponema berlinense]
MRFYKISRVFLFLSVFSSSVFAQEALKSTEEEYYDFLSLTGAAERPTLNYRTLSDSEWQVTDENHLWKDNNLGTKRTLYESDSTETNWFTAGIDRSVKLKLYGPEWFNSYNTKAPYGQNDGALWQGKGYNTSLTAGARLEAYGLELTLKPQVSWSQNREFEFLPGVYGSEYSYFWKGNIDLVQRYGDSSFSTFDWGDTEARYTWHNFTAGFGFQSPWLGPAWLNPMLGSNNAGTYPKFDIGLRKTKVYMPYTDWYLGEIEGRAWLGYLTESDYFDNDSTNDHRQLTGFSVAYSPSILPEFTIGANKICINYWKDKSAKYLNPLYSTNGSQTGNRIDEDQKMSLFTTWKFPQVGFEVYGEFGVDDYTGKGFANPFHTAIYTVGAKKELSFFRRFQKFNIRPEIIFEWSNFEMSQDFQLQWNYMGYYSHGSIAQGYTQNGQILGAGSGYFGNSQYIALRTHFSKGIVTLFLHYNRPDTNYLNNFGVNTKYEDWQKEGKKQHDQWAQYKAMRTYGINAQYFVTQSFLIGIEFNTSWIINPEYKKEKGSGYRNSYGALRIKYNF